ncbi:flagellar hook-associated protein FlgK [Escherichia fergusonii]|uniref:Flagellar hook-associated protein 1 n=1 Tax=Escherichia fergusonii (strain ATCC 35469 / DSM 13698 / CCUG 18766 / IAM 14443 / JCM 21226 / LMG 7866 / NBRC 102419 / NCTC 12128 / CDC 0568-73) TaxID=585054 RepID=B7LT55_ESCF3|nr:flagellar hook-associated protein FlgK [Escherichia fergusonii]EIH2135054.1 flagellar hook-associated protein FlgK [Escherichia fergusonii]EIH2154599.1 flagellar hook-associated protein FlgK [Escherichia fergusonii]EIH9411773.1 flagellar hook-associated protein FlgK [Escherichia fergusonii]EIH9430775.1 flagellar hook-associated protein FlgK [Escherichia fergusonii]QQC69294.1 flagellar hook-associated protein FlgK [Escherichia fergusonii]
MSSLINNAMSGLSAAQAALNTASNNISSYNVAGYTRQTTIMAQANSTLGAGGWVGNGVYVSGVQREYDAFITNQLRAAQTQSSGLTTRYEQMSKIDNLLSSETNNVSTSLQGFFTSLQTLVSNAEDPAARQALIGKADGLVNQFKTTDQYLRDQDKQVNIAIGASVDQINNYAKQIASLNDQISRLTGVGAGASPNDLLDQRDQLVSELNKVVGVEVSVQDGGTYNITMANGYSLVQGSSARQLAAVPSHADPSRVTVAYVDATAGEIEIPEKLLTSGTLGGMLTFRSQDLDQSRNTLGQLALAFADAFNKQHQAGFDATGAKGEDFFAIGKPLVLSNTQNNSDAAIKAEVINGSQVLATDYTITWQGAGKWQVTRLVSNTSFTVEPDAAGNVEFDGLKLTFSGTPKDNNSFTLKPVSDAVVNMDVKVKDESQIALAQEAGAGDSDNRNGQKLLDLQSNGKTVGGAKSFNDAYATLVSDVGNKTATLKTSSTTQNNVVTQLSNQQQSISGVNLDEEYGNLQRFQQYYLANAQVLQTANTLFDALINIR